MGNALGILALLKEYHIFNVLKIIAISHLFEVSNNFSDVNRNIHLFPLLNRNFTQVTVKIRSLNLQQTGTGRGAGCTQVPANSGRPEGGHMTWDDTMIVKDVTEEQLAPPTYPPAHCLAVGRVGYLKRWTCRIWRLWNARDLGG